MKKYELTENVRVVNGETLYQIRALRAFGDVEEGELGGWIAREENLDQDGNAWVFANACVYNTAYIGGEAEIWGDAQIYGDAQIWDEAKVHGKACIYNDAWVCGKAEIYGKAKISGKAQVCGEAFISGTAQICGRAHVSGEAYITDERSILWISNIGSRNGTTTFYTTKTGGIYVNCGCFSGSIEEFTRKVVETHGDNEHAKVYLLAVEMAKVRLKAGAC